MRRIIFAGSFVLGLSVLAFGAPASATTAMTKAQLHAQIVQCDRAAKGHGKVTKGNLSSCKSAHLQVKDKCKNAAGATVVKVNKVDYALRIGHIPVKVTSQCLAPVATAPVVTIPPTTTTTTTTTTTQPPPPPTTAAPLPPPTTAAPASCTPKTDSGNCYEPGEYCRDSDHGASGVAGDGETITCENNNGWRWEPT